MIRPSPNCWKLARAYENRFVRPVSLEDAINTAAKALEPLVPPDLMVHQRDALISLYADVLCAVVIGPEPTFQSSRLLKHLHKGEFQLASAEFLRWCMRGRKVDISAFCKRKAEKVLFTTGVVYVE